MEGEVPAKGRAPLGDTLVASSENQPAPAIGHRGLRRLRDFAYGLTGFLRGTVLLGEFLEVQMRVTGPTMSRSTKGVMNGGIPIWDKVLAELRDEILEELERGSSKGRTEGRLRGN